MSRSAGVFLLAGTLAVANAAATAFDRSFYVRLLAPITSYGRAGAEFTATVIGPVDRDNSPVLPPGSVIHGTVRKAKSVGLGLRRERAELEVQFERCQLPDGDNLSCEAELQRIDNAREEVLSNNRVRGVLAASNANSWFGGVWYRPARALIHRSAVGLTGAGGVINTRYAPGPAGAAIVITSRLLLFRMPEPEIELPVGTELIVRVSSAGAGTISTDHLIDNELPAEIEQWISLSPSEIKQADGGRVADLLNFAFIGSRAQLEAVFRAAGWADADALTPRTFARTYGAYTAMRAYPTSPVSPLYYLGRLPDIVFQKGFNSVAKRHHIRLWTADLGGLQIWLGAATHDTGVTFDWKRMSLTHRIDPFIDTERSKVLNDVEYTGCAIPGKPIARPHLAQQNASEGRAVTDGSLATVLLKDCSPALVAMAHAKPRRSALTLIARRVILETRHYWTRSNAYYWTQRAVRWTFSSLNPRGSE